MQQLEMLQPLRLPEEGRSDLSIDERFEIFHADNPHVFVSVVAIARELKRRGLRRCGMKMIFERLRWLYAIQTRGEDYKLNNNFSALYSRRVMTEVPDLEGFFEIRKRRAND